MWQHPSFFLQHPSQSFIIVDLLWAVLFLSVSSKYSLFFFYRNLKRLSSCIICYNWNTMESQSPTHRPVGSQPEYSAILLSSLWGFLRERECCGRCRLCMKISHSIKEKCVCQHRITEARLGQFLVEGTKINDLRSMICLWQAIHNLCNWFLISYHLELRTLPQQSRSAQETLSISASFQHIFTRDYMGFVSMNETCRLQEFHLRMSLWKTELTNLENVSLSS